ncbi:MAG TPA: methyltransferase domain-containing protein [Candidatus Diapherotrites archaeon]|uniref:Methyltransferase domain-containing protein n=1 Tax=Candidatus Iainarchaeum sp. TaxID=3101447 RepID=A0A7J4J102_9ARCH|nr:methyltransferase domain-containing protein [Candidatus Diapherotrites archaeon]
MKNGVKKMPVYKAGRIVERNRLVSRTKSTERRVLRKPRRWPKENTPLGIVELDLLYPIKKRVAKLAETTEPVVVDWGCGKGVAAAELAREVPKSMVYGFSNNSYTHWNKVLHGNKLKEIHPLQNIKFIHADATDFFRYFKDGSIDILYSKLGICHLKSQVEYIKQLIPKLKIGGILLTETGEVKSYAPLIGNIAPKMDERNRPPHRYVVDVYHQPDYDLEFIKYSNRIIIQRTK